MQLHLAHAIEGMLRKLHIILHCVECRIKNKKAIKSNEVKEKNARSVEVFSGYPHELFYSL